ncbi:MAG: hypothetical protein HYZ50_10530 [Deltaproteobacteria bacterium]|nr:hypothetical protein [Deltaproteobacteria bacterium]
MAVGEGLRYDPAMPSSRKQRFLEAVFEAARSPLAAVEAEVASSRGLSPREQSARLIAVCRAAWAVLRARPDFRQAVEYADPPAADFAAKWDVLMARRRAQRQSRNDGPR